jgi:anti-sigma B factor antagonist
MLPPLGPSIAFEVAAGPQGDVTAFHLRGALDAVAAAQLRLELADGVGRSAVLLDVTGVDFVDSIGLGALLGAIRRIHEGGGAVAIAGPRPGVDDVLRAAGVDRLAFMAASSTEAGEWLRQVEGASLRVPLGDGTAPDPGGLVARIPEADGGSAPFSDIRDEPRGI